MDGISIRKKGEHDVSLVFVRIGDDGNIIRTVVRCEGRKLLVTVLDSNLTSFILFVSTD